MKIHLERLNSSDVTNDYVSWLNNPKVNQYLESRHIKHDLAGVKLFVEAMNQKDENFLFGIFCNKTTKHIGNIKVGPIEYRYQRGEVGLMIGDSSYWGKGVATEAIQLLTHFARETLHLHKLEAGCYVDNIGSLKAFLKVGFEIEGTLKAHVKVGDSWVDCYRLGLIL